MPVIFFSFTGKMLSSSGKTAATVASTLWLPLFRSLNKLPCLVLSHQKYQKPRSWVVFYPGLTVNIPVALGRLRLQHGFYTEAKRNVQAN